MGGVMVTPSADSDSSRRKREARTELAGSSSASGVGAEAGISRNGVIPGLRAGAGV